MSIDSGTNPAAMPLIELDGGIGLFEVCYSTDQETMDRLMGIPMRTKLCSSVTDSTNVMHVLLLLLLLLCLCVCGEGETD